MIQASFVYINQEFWRLTSHIYPLLALNSIILEAAKMDIDIENVAKNSADILNVTTKNLKTKDVSSTTNKNDIGDQCKILDHYELSDLCDPDLLKTARSRLIGMKVHRYQVSS